MVNVEAKGSTAIKSKKSFYTILCLVLILSAAVRIYGLTKQSIWLDEAISVMISEKSFTEIIYKLKDDVHPPLHYFMLHVWIKVFGAGELSTRAFVCMFGILLIPVIYYVGSSLFTPRIGLISAFIASIGQFHVRYSQEVRMYSMLPLIGLLSIFFLYKSLTTDRKGYWIGYTLCTILAMYTHYYGIFIAASGIVFFLIYANAYQTNVKKFFLSQGVIAILYLPWLPILVLRHYGSPRIIPWIPHMQPHFISETFLHYCGLTFNRDGSIFFGLIFWTGLAIFLGCFLAGVFSIKKYKNIVIPYIQKDMKLLLLLCYLLVTLAIPMLISIKKPIFLPSRYSIAAWPVFPLVLGLGIAKIHYRYVFRAILGFMFLVSSISLYDHNFIWVKSYDRSIANFLKSKVSEKDLIVFIPSWIDIPIKYYLHMPFQSLGYPGISDGEFGKKDIPWDPYDMVDLAKSKIKGSSGKIFYVHKIQNWIKDAQTVKRLFNKNFTNIEVKKYGEMFRI